MLSIVIGVVALILIVSVFLFIMNRAKGMGLSAAKLSKDREAAIREANKRLAQNPNDPEALFTLASAQFDEQNWDKALKAYETLSDIVSTTSIQGIDKFEVFLRCGISARKLNMLDQAYKAFAVARSVRQDNFEVNFELGLLEFDRKNYEKAVQLLQQARIQQPDNPAVLRCLGHSLFRLKKPKEAMNFIRKAIDLAPDDKESLYTLAECYHEANQIEQALRVFNHLRADPVMGPNSCLIAGTIHLDTRQYEAAIQDFEIGLRHQNIKVDILAELRYKLSTTLIKMNEIGRAIPYLKQIQAENPSYKDVNILLGKYIELNANRNLQIFLMASSADFIALCRKIVMTYYPKAKVKITNISVTKNDWADILAEVDTFKWQDVIMFRFIRTQGSIGELVVRDFGSHLKEVKAGKGICMTVGNYTEEAKRYTEARLIDLIEKERLQQILNSVDAKAAAMK
ncbi:MAG: tetratricopeptide repeat protein [Treponema sp.]|nr:tetratricopeptide repeat protein [Treponema sp.]MCL2250725.1 tetratricopeptide repeat protein [Treponema sp.]